MTEIVKPGARVLYMKVGKHADEPLDEIIARKVREIEDAGFALWGYGGNTCHPVTMVQPFAKAASTNSPIYLCMQPMNSSHFAVTARADEFSVDGINWQPVPDGIHVTGSRYALAIRGLRRVELAFPLAQTRVAVGNSIGMPGSKYISGRVDKACLEVVGTEQHAGHNESAVAIGLIAEIVEPYAVFVRNKIK